MVIMLHPIPDIPSNKLYSSFATIWPKFSSSDGKVAHILVHTFIRCDLWLRNLHPSALIHALSPSAGSYEEVDIVNLEAKNLSNKMRFGTECSMFEFQAAGPSS